MSKIKKNETKAERRIRKYDSAWKNVVRKLFKDFLEFFFPEIHDAIDFDKGFTFLDKELKEVVPDSMQGDKNADFLVKVHLLNGQTQYIGIIIHIEIQGQPQHDFMERMLIYNYRIFDLEKREQIQVISVAILTDNDKDFRLQDYSVNLFGFVHYMRIPYIKILDYKYKQEYIDKLKNTTNPMSMIVIAQLKSLESNLSDNEKKFEVKKELIRQCFLNGYDSETTRITMHFFDWVIRLPEEYKQKIEDYITTSKEELKMEYIATWERDTFERGVDVGRLEGKREGEKKARIATAKKMLKEGFTIDMIAKLTNLDTQTVSKLAKEKPQEIRQ